MKTNFILVDYENVQPTDMRVLDRENFRVVIFVGANQSKVALDVAVALQDMGSRAKYVKISGNGPNALDFHIAFYVGQLAIQYPEAYFHIISNDTGFDPLIQHLRERKLYIQRSKCVREVPVVRVLQASTLNDKVVLAKEDLARRGEARPKTVETLLGTINSLFHKSLTEEELSLIVRELHSQQVINITETKVLYRL